jgi:transcription antitermination factor NusG
MNWYAVTTRPNLEKSATAGLQGKGLEAWLPLYRVRRRWSDRIKQLDLPVFAGYTFCRFQPDRRALVVITPGATGIVGFAGSPAPIDDAEIAALRQTIASGVEVQPWPFVKVGQRVVVTSGPLTGVEGIVQEFRKEYRLIVSISMLQRSLSVEIDRYSIEPLGNAAAQPSLACAGVARRPSPAFV